MILNTSYPQTCAPGTVNGQPVPADYMAEAQLAREIVPLAGLDEKAWRVLLAAIRSGLPVVLTRRDPAMTSIKGSEVHQRIVAVVEYASIGEHSSRIRVGYWGFGHEVYLADVVAVATPEVTYLDVDA